MLEIREMHTADDLVQAVLDIGQNQEKEIAMSGSDFVIISRENYYKLKEYEATCSGLL